MCIICNNGDARDVGVKDLFQYNIFESILKMKSLNYDHLLRSVTHFLATANFPNSLLFDSNKYDNFTIQANEIFLSNSICSVTHTRSNTAVNTLAREDN